MPYRIKTVGGWWVWVPAPGRSGFPTMGHGHYVYEQGDGCVVA